MTTDVDIANRALIQAGIPKRLNNLAQDSTEAQTITSILHMLRDDLNRLAPWNCTRKYANLTYITSQPGTPENSAAGPPLWVPGIPAPQWAYEYQYPVDCIRPRNLLPQYTSLAGGTPIYPLGTVTGFSPIGWTGPALKYEVSTDQFFPVTAAAVVNTSRGTGYAVGDLITLVQPSFTFTQAAFSQNATFTMPVGAPAILQVATIGAAGAITTVNVITQNFNEPVLFNTVPFGGSYFSTQNPSNVAQGSTTGLGTGALFNLTFGPQGSQRVIICNQESAILCYNTRVTDPNVMDTLFQDAWVSILASRLAYQLTGNVNVANSSVELANRMIAEARIADGNENITVNDVTPDWLRTRGNFGGPNWEYTPNMSFDWGSFYSPY